MRRLIIGAFIAGAVTYLAFFVGCIGSEAGSGLSQACSPIGPLLRIPLLYWLPYADSRYFGVDSMFIAIAGNAVFWGGVAAAIAFLVARTRKRSAPTS